MSAATKNFTIKRGSGFRRVITWKQSTGAPVNITGWTARMQFRASEKAAAAELDLSEGAGITIDGAAGKITFAITAAQTAAIVADKLVYDLLLIPPAAEPECKLQGTCKVLARVTQV